MHSQEFSFYRE